MKSVAAGGAASTFRPGTEPRGDLQRIEIALPSAVSPGASATVTVNLHVAGRESIAVLPRSVRLELNSCRVRFWYPMPNTPYTLRGADTAPFRLTVNIANAISSGVEKTGSAGSISFDQSIHGQPFFVQGDWDKVEGAGDGKGVAVLLEKGASAEDRKTSRSVDRVRRCGAFVFMRRRLVQLRMFRCAWCPSDAARALTTAALC